MHIYTYTHTQSLIPFFKNIYIHTSTCAATCACAHTHTQREREYVPISGYIPEITMDVIKAWNDFTDKLQHRAIMSF